MKKRNPLIPWLYVAPTLLILAAYLVYPTLNTLYLSFLDKRSESFVGLKNYAWVFTSSTMRTAFRNNLLWIVLFTALTVSLGLILAVMADRVRYESSVKSTIFLPMAISFVGA
ncbi:MAG TPA: sugar ABC transporter permease, partial [Chloroflexi bacterium]|nr:sugar ABC transporter permease [Chloroflexota bacterium]